MNIDTGRVVQESDISSMGGSERSKYAKVPRHMAAAAAAVMMAGDSMFSSRNCDQRTKSQAASLAKKHKAKVRKQMKKASRRRNRK